MKKRPTTHMFQTASFYNISTTGEDGSPSFLPFHICVERRDGMKGRLGCGACVEGAGMGIGWLCCYDVDFDERMEGGVVETGKISCYFPFIFLVVVVLLHLLLLHLLLSLITENHKSTSSSHNYPYPANPALDPI